MTSTGFTVILRCSDPRLDAFFEREEHRSALGLGPRSSSEEAYICNVGGLLPFSGARRADLAADIGTLLSIFGQGHGRVLLTAHSSCGGYHARFSDTPSALRARQEHDMREVAYHIGQAMPHVRVSCFYLQLENDTIVAL